MLALAGTDTERRYLSRHVTAATAAAGASALSGGTYCSRNAHLGLHCV